MRVLGKASDFQWLNIFQQFIIYFFNNHFFTKFSCLFWKCLFILKRNVSEFVTQPITIMWSILFWQERKLMLASFIYRLQTQRTLKIIRMGKCRIYIVRWHFKTFSLKLNVGRSFGSSSYLAFKRQTKQNSNFLRILLWK